MRCSCDNYVYDLDKECIDFLILKQLKNLGN